MPIKIRSLRTSAGFLKDAPIEIADGLTCIIGARGTCKSTVIETIRFAFDCDRDRVDKVLLGEPTHDGSGDAPPQTGLIRATLEEGSVCCEIDEEGATGTFRLTIERDIRSRPRVYREGIKELSDAAVLDQIEIYSQGDLQRFAESDSLRLDLIDRPHKAVIDQLKQQRKEQIDLLRDLGPSLRAKRGEIEARRSKVQGLDQLRAQLASMQAERPALSEELDREREAFLARKSLLERSQAALTARGETLAALRAATDGLPNLDGLPDELRGTSLAEAEALACRLAAISHPKI
jgi:DNA repair ATPase RecN